MTTKEDEPVSLITLARIGQGSDYSVISTDLFDTVLLRDSSTETQRLAQAARRAAAELRVDADTLMRLRWLVHDASYRAVAIERPTGDASLAHVARVVAAALGLPNHAVGVLINAEVETDITHLSSNRPLLRLLTGLRTKGKRVIAVSDTYYSAHDLRRIMVGVIGFDPFDEIYSSADLNLTKHSGSIFPMVLRKEDVRPQRVLHIGDNLRADVDQPDRAGWSTAHLPRRRGAQVIRWAGRALRFPAVLARYR